MWRPGEVREGRNWRAELGWEGYGDPGWSGVSLSHPSLETLRQPRIREKTEKQTKKTESVKQGWQREKGLISFQIPRATPDFTSWNQSGPNGNFQTNRSVSKRNSALRWDTTLQAAHITFFCNFGVYLRNYLQNTESQDRKGQNIKLYPSRKERPQTKLQRY